MELILFDLDNTLLAGDSDYAWAQFLIDKGLLERSLQEAKNHAFYEHYQAGTLNIDEFLDFQLAPLTRLPRATLDTWRDEFISSRIRPLIGEAARALVEQHRKADALLAIVTATNAFITGPIAREFDIPHLIATIPAWDGARFTGKARGMPAFQAAKIARVESWLESIGYWWGSFTRSKFYSDSLNDLPLLEKVTHPVAVDPDATLRRHALERGWPIVSLRT